MKNKTFKMMTATLAFTAVAAVSAPAYADVNSHLVNFIRDNIESADEGFAKSAESTDISVIQDNTWLRVLCSFSVKYFILGVTLQPEVELHW